MNSRQGLVAGLMLLIALPLAFLFATAIADGQQRSEEAPFRAVLGNARFEALQNGEGGFPHYLGNSLSAPDFTLPDRFGVPWKRSDHLGKTIVMNFWTVTCRPCLEEMPALERLSKIAEEWPDTEIVLVSTDENWDAVRGTVSGDAPITYLFDPERSVVTDRFGTKYFPETWIIDKHGVVRMRYDGARDWSSPVMLDVIRAFR